MDQEKLHLLGMRFSTDGLYIELIGALIIEMSEVLSSADQRDSIKKSPVGDFSVKYQYTGCFQ